MQIEKGSWMALLSGTKGDNPPTEDQAFLEFARGLPDPSLYECIKDAIPCSKIYGYRCAENRLRHFEQLRRQPEGFIVMGDAVCCFNPIYGQGMTVAVLEALELDTCLQKRGMGKGFAHAFQRRVARVLTVPWMLATAADRGNKYFGLKYTEHLFALLEHDPSAMLTFLEVVHMLKHPLALLHPAILLKMYLPSKI